MKHPLKPKPAYSLLGLLLLAACAAMTPQQRIAALQDSYEAALDKALFYQQAGVLTAADQARLSDAFSGYETAIAAARAALRSGTPAGGELQAARAAIAVAEQILIRRAQEADRE